MLTQTLLQSRLNGKYRRPINNKLNAQNLGDSPFIHFNSTGWGGKFNRKWKHSITLYYVLLPKTGLFSRNRKLVIAGAKVEWELGHGAKLRCCGIMLFGSSRRRTKRLQTQAHSVKLLFLISVLGTFDSYECLVESVWEIHMPMERIQSARKVELFVA